MEGLIPFVYRAIVQYRNGKEGHHPHHVLATWFSSESSPSASYMRLPTGDSGRFQTSDDRVVFESDQIILSTGTVQSPAIYRPTPRRVVA